MTTVELPAGRIQGAEIGPLWVFRNAAAAAQGGATYRYRIDWRPPGSLYGACHCIDLPLLFGDEATWRGVPMLGAAPWPAVERLGRRVRAAWTAFAATGDPNVDGDEVWPPLVQGQGQTRTFDG